MVLFLFVKINLLLGSGYPAGNPPVFDAGAGGGSYNSGYNAGVIIALKFLFFFSNVQLLFPIFFDSK